MMLKWLTWRTERGDSEKGPATVCNRGGDSARALEIACAKELSSRKETD